MSQTTFSRRSALGMAVAAAAVPVLAACTSSATTTTPKASSQGPLKFWDMPWGTTTYNSAAEALTNSYKPDQGLPPVQYQTIQWANSYQTFAAAISSKTGPAISTGSGYQAFQFAGQGAIAYADSVVDKMKANGLYADFLPNLVDAMKTKDGYVAVPWQMDCRVLWYRKSLLEQAGASVPTDWDSLMATAKALSKIGVCGFGMAAGTGTSNLGKQAILSMMINNGGGLFDETQKPNAVTDRNIETVDFLLGMVKAGIMQPGAAGFSVDNLNTQWKDKKIAVGFMPPGFPASIGVPADDLTVTSPLTGPHGDKGTLMYVNNIMMYKENPSQAGTEAFLMWYLKNIKTYWDQNLINSLPVFKSVTETDSFRKDPANVKIIQEWQPHFKPFSAVSKTSWPSIAAVESSSAFHSFSQEVLKGTSDAKTILTTLQKGMVEAMK
jgi:multiple sugar transport system substrate-binding protein